MITSVELDEELFNEAWALSGLKTKKAMFGEVLRVYVSLHQQAQVRELRGKFFVFENVVGDAVGALSSAGVSSP